ncbi:UNVERIFIED_CONTAM: hypothetical protein FKN15_039222 [Acipenser sinensis]
MLALPRSQTGCGSPGGRAVAQTTPEVLTEVGSVAICQGLPTGLKTVRPPRVLELRFTGPFGSPLPPVTLGPWALRCAGSKRPWVGPGEWRLAHDIQWGTVQSPCRHQCYHHAHLAWTVIILGGSQRSFVGSDRGLPQDSFWPTHAQLGPPGAQVGLGGIKRQHPVLLADIGEECILGADVLMAMGATLDLGQQQLWVQGGSNRYCCNPGWGRSLPSQGHCSDNHQLPVHQPTSSLARLPAHQSTGSPAHLPAHQPTSSPACLPAQQLLRLARSPPAYQHNSYTARQPV